MDKFGTKMPVHHIDVDSVGACTLRLGDLFPQAGEVGREDRWGKLYRISPHVAPLSVR
jgi:hypothetical protein